MENLRFLLQGKKADSAKPCEGVSKAISWVHTQFRNAEVPYHSSDGGSGHGIYGYSQIKSLLHCIADFMLSSTSDITALCRTAHDPSDPSLDLALDREQS